jgi:glutamate receptor, ionotropic, plant
MDLLANDHVEVIIGPQTSAQAQIIAQVCNRAHVPMVSFSATLPSLCLASVPYFVRATFDGSLLATPIASFVHLYGWRNVVLILDDSGYGGDIFAQLIRALQEVDVIISDYVMVPTSASDDHIDAELYKLKTQQTRVFIVHMVPNLASRTFIHAAKAGMTTKDCSWIVTNSVSAVLETFDQDALDAMQGIIGFRPHVPNSRTKSNFVSRFKTQFRKDHPQIEPSSPTLYELWAYDAIWSIAYAAEKIGVSKLTVPMPAIANNNLTCFHKLASSATGLKYLNTIRETQFSGLSGEFRLVGGQLQVSALEIINVIGKSARLVGFWTEERGITGALNTTNGTFGSSLGSLKTIIWPGDTIDAPRGFAITTGRSTLRVAVPDRKGIEQLVNSTDKSKISGYCIDVFDAVMRRLPYFVPYEYIPVVTETYDELITMLYRKVKKKKTIQYLLNLTNTDIKTIEFDLNTDSFGTGEQHWSTARN